MQRREGGVRPRHPPSRGRLSLAGQVECTDIPHTLELAPLEAPHDDTTCVTDVEGGANVTWVPAENIHYVKLGAGGGPGRARLAPSLHPTGLAPSPTARPLAPCLTGACAVGGWPGW
jgi:hypothetical protein